MSVPRDATPQALALLEELGARTLDHPGAPSSLISAAYGNDSPYGAPTPPCSSPACAMPVTEPTAFPSRFCRWSAVRNWRR